MYYDDVEEVPCVGAADADAAVQRPRALSLSLAPFEVVTGLINLLIATARPTPGRRFRRSGVVTRCHRIN